MFKKLLYDSLADKDRASVMKKIKWMEYLLPAKTSRFAVPFVVKGSRYFRSLKPLQTPGEIQAAYDLCCELEPKRVLEIGTAKGGTLYLWCQAAADDATLISVDLPGGKFGGGYVEQRTELYQSYARAQQKLHLLRANSHHESTLNEVKTLLGDEPLDFVFIDGDHFYEGVRDDFVQYGQLVRPGGVILFHDIKPAPHDEEIEVNQLWDQLHDYFETKELIADDKRGRHLGIGVVTIGENGWPEDLKLK